MTIDNEVETKLNYICNPDSRLCRIEFLNHVDFSNGFVCELNPLYANLESEPIFKVRGVSVDCNCVNAEAVAMYGFPMPQHWDCWVKIMFEPGELNQFQMNRLKKYMLTLQCHI